MAGGIIAKLPASKKKLKQLVAKNSFCGEKHENDEVNP